MTNTIENISDKDKTPTHKVFVNAYMNGSPVKVKVGVAWKHTKGNGFNISLDNMVVFENRDLFENSDQS